MTIRIAIPEPTTSDAAYNARSLPPYLAAVQSCGALPVIIPLHERQDRVAALLAGTQGVLLPGSGFDVDPERYGAARLPVCGPADTGRTAVDELLLQDAFNLRKPILGICHGCQTLNVWMNGTLIQDLATVLDTPINHAPGREVIDAHPIQITAHSRLASIARSGEGRLDIASSTSDLNAQCNSSHHQAVDRVGDNLRVTAISPRDGVIEAIELESADHFAVGVQWHPERTYTSSPLSRALFNAFVRAVEAWHPRTVETSVAGA